MLIEKIFFSYVDNYVENYVDNSRRMWITPVNPLCWPNE